MADYRSLLVWQKAHQLVLAVYRATERMPPSELYGLTSQLRRAAVSVPANIAEGYGRGSDAESARFCRISLGSLNELEYHLLLATDLGYLLADNVQPLEAAIAEVRRMPGALVRRLDSARRQPD